MGNVITITDAAATHIRTFLEGTPAGVGLCVGVRGGGCNGLTYDLGLEKPDNPSKYMFIEENGIPVYIDKKSKLYLAEATIDYVSGLMQSGFKIENPNSKGSCGCGQSTSF